MKQSFLIPILLTILLQAPNEGCLLQCATIVGFSCAYQNKHWASNVVLGAALGELCGRVVTSYHAGRSRVALTPQIYESGAGLALVGTW